MDNEKQVLIAKILSLFQRYGIRSVTTDDISKELGISKKTLYEHFSDKSQIVELAILMVVEEIEGKVTAIKARNQNAILSLLELYKLMASYMRDFSPSFDFDLRKYYPEVYSKVFSNLDKCIYNMHVENITQGKREGIYREVNADIIARLLSHRVQSNAQEVFSSQELAAGNVHKEIFLYHLFGVCNARGFELANSYLADFEKSINKMQ